MNARANLVSVLLRVGLAFAFLYAAIASFVEPDAWVGYMPIFLRHLVPAHLLLGCFSVVEILLALWLLSGQFLLYSSLLAAIMLAGIVALNSGALDIVFRDVALLFSAVALMAIGYGAQ